MNDEASAWREADVDFVVSLLQNDEAAQLNLLHERQAAEDHDIDFISFPIPDRGVPAPMQDAVSLIARIGAQLEAGKNVAVHCGHGVPIPETLAQRQWTEQLLSGLSVPKR